MVVASQVSSILWVGPALLYSSESHIGRIPLDGASDAGIIMSQLVPHAVLVSASADSVLMAHHSSRCDIDLIRRPIGLFEPLVCSWLDWTALGLLPSLDDGGSDAVSAMVARYDGRRVSLALLRRLDHSMLCSLAYLVCTAYTDRRVDGLLHSKLAMNSHDLQRASELLWTEFVASASFPKLEHSHPLFQVYHS